ncbi:MAG: hypothetical protein WBL70_19670 [Candidatus Acidiferrales bacterium]
MMKIKRAPICLLALAAFVPSGGTQEVKHPPTVEHCRADVLHWAGRLNSDNKGGDVSILTLAAMNDEMSTCLSVNPGDEEHYLLILHVTEGISMVRMRDFIDRHNLSKQFIDEDKAGER